MRCGGKAFGMSGAALDADGLLAMLEDIRAGIVRGEVTAVALVGVVARSGGLDPGWWAAPSLGPHAGSILRGAAAYLGARMDAEALEGERVD